MLIIASLNPVAESVQRRNRHLECKNIANFDKKLPNKTKYKIQQKIAANCKFCQRIAIKT